MSYKTKIKNIYFKLKNRDKKIKIGKNSEVGFKSEFSGVNRIGKDTVFTGKIGYGSYIGDFCHLSANIGKYCCIAGNVNVVNGLHPSTKFVSIHPSFYSLAKQSGETYVTKQCFNENVFADENGKYSVIIGNDVWVGYGATILGGITIGDGAIIAANATVVQNVEPFTIVGGVPAKPIKKRFADQQITFLCDFKWWDREINWIKEHAESFQDIEQFISLFEGDTQ